MNQHQEIQQISTANAPIFKYGELEVEMGHRYSGVGSWNEVLLPYAEVYWKGLGLGEGKDAPDALKLAFNAVRICRPGPVVYKGDERALILRTLASLGPLFGIELARLIEPTEVETRLHPEADRLREVFKHWDDRPQVTVYSSLSSVDSRNFHNEAIMYRVHMSTFANTFTHQVTMPSWDLIDLDTLLVDLMIKHFA